MNRHRALTVILTIVLAPGLCLALPGSAMADVHAEGGFAAPHHGHGMSHCAPDECCPTALKSAKKDEDAPAVTNAALPAAPATPATGPTDVPFPAHATARPIGPPARNLPLLC